MPKTSPNAEAPIDGITAALPLPSSSTFQLTWPAGEEPPVHSIPTASQAAIELAQQTSSPPNINPFFDPVPMSEVDYVAEAQASSKVSTPIDEAGPIVDGVNDDPNHPNQPPKRPTHLPRFSRASSTPLPAQLKHLHHPSRRNFDESPAPSPVVVAMKKSLPPPPPAHPQIAELALELADSVQTVIQTLIQVSPPHLLDPAKEQLSGCTLQIPTTSVSALLTTMKNLNYMSANLSTLSSPEKTPPLKTVTEEDLHVVSEIKSLDMGLITGDGEEILVSNPKTLAFDEFDIGEALQSVGDVLSGISASAGVDLVLYHADVGMKHVNVRGDECGILYSISYVIRQIIAVAQPRDEIEIGLYVSSPTGARLNREYSSGGGVGVPPSPTPSTDPEEPLVCTLEITHRFASPNPVPCDGTLQPPPPPQFIHERRQPELNTAILQNTLRHVRATLQTDVTPSSGAQIPNSRTYELSVLLSPGPAGTPPGYPLSEEEIKARQPFHDFKVASEPTLDELASFVAADGGLKGKKAVFHASERSSFAHHLTSYLTAWGMDVSHVPIESGSCPALAGEGESSTATSSVAGDAVDGVVETESASSKSSRSRAGSDVEVKVGTPKTGTPKSETPKSESPESSASSTKARQLDALAMEPITSEGLLQQPGMAELAGTNFIIIDDDVNVLRRRLGQIRKAAIAKFRPQTLPQTIGSLRKRPGLQHRPRSSPSIRMATTQPSIPGTIEEGHSETEESTNKTVDFDPLQVVILHFTSLSNYKVVQDTIYASVFAASDNNMTTYSGAYSPYPMGEMIPEVLVIPKPAGPRRFLTALHTAVQKPFIDPFFAPIATTPMSPTAQFRVSPWGLPLGGTPSIMSTPHGLAPALAANAVAAAAAAAAGAGTPASRIVTGRQHSSGSTGSAGGSVTSSSSRLPTLGSTASGDRRSPKGHPAEQQILQQQQQQINAAIAGAGTQSLHSVVPVVPMTYTGQPHMYTPHPPSPLSRDAVEYFSVNAAATQIGDSTGVLVHSPDGRPAGIFFQPQQQSREGRRSNSNSSSAEQQSGLGVGGRPQVRPQPASFMGLDAALANVSPVVTPGGVFPPPTRFRGSPADTNALPSPTTPVRGLVAVRRSTGGGEDPGRPPLARNLSSRAGVPLAPVNGVPRRKTSNTGSDGGTGGAKVTPDRPRPLQIESAGAAVAPAQNNRPSLVESPRSSSNGSSPGLPRKVGRRSTGERPSLVSGKKVKSSGDGSIVPPINVLIVEDNPINQTILSTFMKRKKINYGTAKNGQEAIDKWRSGNYHLILMDIMMPVKDGIEATKEIRGLEKERNSTISPSTPPSELQEAAKATNVPHSPYRSSVIIVALTASEQKSDRVAALAAGCNDFLTKPVSMNWLNTKIIEWGSIKALEMFQDPATARLFNAQNAKTKIVASQLKLPPSRNPSPAPADAPEPAIVRPVLTFQAPSTPDLPTTSNPDVAPPLQAPEPEPQETTLSTPPISPRSAASELSGEEALKKHVQAINEEEARRRDATAHARPVILGEGGISSENSSTSIESVLRGIPPIAEDATTPETPPSSTEIQTPAVPMAPPSGPPESVVIEQRPAYP
ncbi:ssk1 response regulator receiver [Tulasnella sp. 417]|nr:ssk1 response regulator receiver [Tulasnella sp. 417]